MPELVKLAAGGDLRFVVRVEVAEPNKVTSESLAKVAELLQKVSADLTLGSLRR